MREQFTFDVFLSYHAKDKAVVRPLALRLREDGLRVWFDEWEIRPGDSIATKIEEGCERSRVLVLCLSTHLSGTDWPQFETATYRFRDPLNIERRFIPVRLDDAPMRGSVARFAHVDWRLDDERDAEYAKLLAACRPPADIVAPRAPTETRQADRRVLGMPHDSVIWSYAFHKDGERILTGANDHSVRLWHMSRVRPRMLEGHEGDVRAVAWHPAGRYVLSGSPGIVRLTDLQRGGATLTLAGHSGTVWSVAWSPDGRRFMSGADDNTIRHWDLDDESRGVVIIEGHTAGVLSVAWSPNGRSILSGSEDGTLRIWGPDTGLLLATLEGHTDAVFCAAFTPDGRYVVSGSADRTVRVWDVENVRCLRVLEGHSDDVRTLACDDTGRLLLTGSRDTTVRLWDVTTGACLSVLTGHEHAVRGVAWSADRTRAFSGDQAGHVITWDLSDFATDARLAVPETGDVVRYTNAKVLLVGESGAGKSGLARRLTQDAWTPTDSTTGAWSMQWRLPTPSTDAVEREIWLWDFGGQADQRLIHQLHMEDTALAVLVFDPRREDIFETLDQWDRDLTRASRKAFAKLLVAARMDVGGARLRRDRIEEFARSRGFAGYIETSAKQNAGCDELRDAIVANIRWDEIPWTSSPRLFRRLKDEILRLKDEGRVLMRFNELRDALRLRLGGESASFSDQDLFAAINLLAHPGLIWELKFGSAVLLQPERINAYAQAVIDAVRRDELERGCVPEKLVLSGELPYVSDMPRLSPDDERFVLFAMHHTFIERGLCLREHTEEGPLLIFPSYYRRERPELMEHPAVLVSYKFAGFLDDIYATLIVRLHHTQSFQADQLWRYAAEFKTLTGKQLGIKLTRREEGLAELDVYFDTGVSIEEKIIFSRYVHEHLLQQARDVVRLRHYVCPHCGTPVGNRELAMRRLEAWLEKRSSQQPTIVCQNCEKRVPLWDELEKALGSRETQQRVRELQDQAAMALDSESKERILVGEVISTVALAGQICREYPVSDRGIDMEIEFTDDAGVATGRKLFLQVKTDDSYLRERRDNGAEMFTIQSGDLAQHWMSLDAPVMLLIRAADGEVRWMDLRDALRRETPESIKAGMPIVFNGERFDVLSVRRWREQVLPPSRAALAAQVVSEPDVERRFSLLERVLTEVDDVSRDLLRDRARRDPAGRIRRSAVRLLALNWTDERTRDDLMRIALEDVDDAVRFAVYDVLSKWFWKDSYVRTFLRSRQAGEPQPFGRELLTHAIHRANYQIVGLWKDKLAGDPDAAKDAATHAIPGYPAFRLSAFRLRNIGPFHDTGWLHFRPGVNVLLGDNSAGKTTLLKCMALAGLGLPAANEVETDASRYLRKGADRGNVDALFELIIDPDSPDSPTAVTGHFAVGLQIDAGSSRFSAGSDTVSLEGSGHSETTLPNGIEHLGSLRSMTASPFGFVSGYGATRTFSEARDSAPPRMKERENAWVRSLFQPDAWLMTPEAFTQLLRGDVSSLEESGLPGLPASMLDALRGSLERLLPGKNRTLLAEGQDDLQLYGARLQFDELSDGYRSLLAMTGHFLASALKVRSWMHDPTSIDGLLLIDEIDLHLHPAWQHQVVHDFHAAFTNVQLIASTHSPLVISALTREDVYILRREEDGRVTISRPESDPQGLGVAGILMRIFDLRSTLDQPTLDKITRRVRLHATRERWTEAEQTEYAALTKELAALGFTREFSDPYLEQFAVALARRREASLERLTPQERLELDDYADTLLTNLLAKGSQSS